ncbi:hypothetical protein KHQ81_15530 (plasmid) [Mycoplasmatota bacterium]|nr:hypothetical protein KHQ81_15530 [Mycoplasmatota bacterium]
MKKILKSKKGSPSLEYIGTVVLVGIVVLGVIGGFGIMLKNSLQASQEQVQQKTYDALCQSAKENDTSTWTDANDDGKWQETECSAS